MTRNDVMELAGIGALVAGGAGFAYGLYLLALWLVLIVGGVLWMAFGAALIYRANRGGA